MSSKHVIASLALYGVMQWAPGIAQAQGQQQSLQSRVQALEATVAAQQQSLAEAQATIVSLQSAIVANLRNCVSVSGTDVIFSGCNVHVRNGLGQTTSENALGNLIVGYNEAHPFHVPPAPIRTGSHNLVVGRWHSWTSHGGFLAGQLNTASGPFASVSGGQLNNAIGISASVSGGSGNQAGGDVSSISGGSQNSTLASWSSISGGQFNAATATFSTISGGYSNATLLDARYATVGGGSNRQAVGEYDWAAGGLFQDF